MSIGMMFLLSCIGCAFGCLGLYLGIQFQNKQHRWLLTASYICWFIFVIFIIWYILYVMPELMFGKPFIRIKNS